MSVHARTTDRSAREKDSWDARLIFFVCFVPSLVRVAAKRCLRGRASHQSIVHEARAAAYTCVSFAFMG